ncbi:hypothetical protein [Solidesulfovibrio sp.]|uniref:hypothetical protein n=1 Tax=Solidesulfovibrio sp. TaxID=2910990 RepID=UPI002B1E9DFC|nr:hypothetical protein [Solidesulfovibrio sp.]MEA5089598.1 hypothetical protein [Solidesulfovibrio sp.]HML54557.1 hypothetical protein [Solidesulfovibrio magneticus]
MARKTLRDQLRESAKSATSIGAEHRAIVRELDANASSQRKSLPSIPAEILHLPSSSKSSSADEPQNENRTTQTDRVIGQDERTTGQDNRTTQTDNWTGQEDKRTGQPDKERGQEDKISGQDERTTQTDKVSGQPDKITGQNERTTQTGNATGHDKRTDQADKVNGQDTNLPLFLPNRSAPRTSGQKLVLEYFMRQGSHIANYDVIAAQTRLPYRTVRRGIDKLVSLGWLTKQAWYQGSSRGLKFNFHPQTGQDGRTGQTDKIIGQDERTGGQDIRTRYPDKTSEQDERTSQTDKNPPPYKEKIDRENLSISLTSERITLTWPHLSRSGFGPDQLVQIGQALAELGKSADKVLQSLDHAEWELEHDAMCDKDGQPVADPCSWVFRSLARTGYYRRPKGYVSPEEQAAKDAEAEAKAVTVARQAAEQAQFETWRDGLTPDELADAMRGHPGGPKDAWLKSVWKKTR